MPLERITKLFREDPPPYYYSAVKSTTDDVRIHMLKTRNVFVSIEMTQFSPWTKLRQSGKRPNDEVTSIS